MFSPTTISAGGIFCQKIFLLKITKFLFHQAVACIHGVCYKLHFRKWQLILVNWHFISSASGSWFHKICICLFYLLMYFLSYNLRTGFNNLRYAEDFTCHIPVYVMLYWIAFVRTWLVVPSSLFSFDCCWHIQFSSCMLS